MNKNPLGYLWVYNFSCIWGKLKQSQVCYLYDCHVERKKILSLLLLSFEFHQDNETLGKILVKGDYKDYKD